MSGQRHFSVRLPMYDWPEVRGATARLEHALQSALTETLDLAPEDIRPWPGDLPLHEAWQHPDVLLTQTCGYPLTHLLKDKVAPVGVPHYSAEGCEGPAYCSRIIVAASSAHETLADLRGGRAVFNGSDSQSGYNAFRHAVSGIAGGKPFFGCVTASGSHLASVKAVAARVADAACIDSVCWWLVVREMPELAKRVRPIAQTACVPGLPLITSRRFPEPERVAIAETVAKVLAAPETQESRERLGIRGFSRVSAADYAGILLMEQEAAESGYPKLA